VRATNTDTDEPLPLTPPLRGILGLQAHHGQWLGVHNGTAEIDLVMVDEQHRPAPLDQVTAGYGLVNINAGFDASLVHHELHVDLGVRNLLNHSYRDFLSRYKAFALNPGGDIVLRLDWSL
jgi:iron complex outermembrane receptor protein